MAHTLADVVFRRTDLATGGNPGYEALRRCAALMAEHAGWDEQEINAQLDRVKSRFPAWD
jgi:glycerol-3-phosphate dehydrogenase